MKKRLLSMLLAVCMLLSMLPMGVFAGDAESAPTVAGGKASLNGTEYDTLDAAMEAAVSGDTIYLGAGTYQGSSDANKGNGAGKTLTFVGAGTDQTTWNILENGYRGSADGYVDYSFDNRNAATPVTVTFKNMTMVSGVNLSGTNTTGNYGDNDYLRGLVGVDNMVLEDCVVNGIISYWGYSSTTCNNVVFNAPTMTKYYIFKAANYSLWTYTGTEYTFNSCTFNNNGKAINVYRHWNDNKVVTINFNSCKAVYTKADGVANSDKMVMNINDSTMANGSYIINITGNNETVNYYDASAVTCSRLFSFGDTSDTSYNSGKTKVTMGGTTVWENGKMVDADTYHLTGVTPTEGSYTNGVKGAESSWYAEGHKDHKVTTTYTDWVASDDGTSYTRTATTECGYCNWSKKETQTGYQVTYNLNEGTGAKDVSYDAETVVSGGTVTAKTAPTREGYTFTGWKVDDNTTYQPDTEITVDSNITLTAQWAVKTYTVTFDSNGGTTVDSQTVNYNEKATQPEAPTKEATAQYTYTFKGWKLGDKDYDFATPVTSDITLVADWEATTNQYNLTYVTNGGSAVEKVTANYGTEVAVDGKTTKTGYTFTGWYSDKECTKKVDAKITLTGDVTVYAGWTINSYTVTFDSKGGTAVPSQTVNYSEKATEPTAPTKAADAQYTYTFKGWKLGDKDYDFATPVTSDITLVADWEATTNQYNLTYVTNGGSAVNAVKADYGTEVTVDGKTTKTGYTFTGWYTDEACTTKATEKVTLNSNITVYAGWTINSYTVTFDSKGGTAVPSQTVNYNGKAEEPTAPTRDGYTFKGWTLNNETYSFDTAVTKSITLIAVWEKKDSTPELEKGDHYAYIIGYTDGTVQPEGNITRAEVATIFFRLLTEETREANLTDKNDFSDVAAKEWYNKAISTLAKMGIVEGDAEAPTFRPDDPITRAEFAAIAARFDKSGTTGKSVFTDVPSEHWALDLINKAAALGWIKGDEGTTNFRPDDNITRAEAMTLINRVLERAVDKDGVLSSMKTWSDNSDTGAWYYYDVQEATNSHDYERSDRSMKDRTAKAENWTKITANRDWTKYQK